ncbi:MAG: DUF1566 domain-containing protein [Treponema sp.]|nr:DUF1566 domain-containing protein [Treponema sp.]
MKKLFRTKNIRRMAELIVIIAVIGLSIIACPSQPIHSCEEGGYHFFPNWTEPTCTVAGNIERSCIYCMAKDTRTTGYAALGHYTLNAVGATCAENGNTGSGICIRTGCGQVVTGTLIPSLGHDHVGSLICKRTGCNHYYALGDTGPAGGKIFYIAPAGFNVTSTTTAFTTYTAHYLEAAPANVVSGRVRWSTSTSEPFPTVTTGSGIGSGRNNTALIIAAEKAAYPSFSYSAALACDEYINYFAPTYTDWFLPSRGELNILYLRRTDVGIASGTFWSSSQRYSSTAWNRDFGNGYEHDDYKGYTSIVRPVRAF